MSAKRRRSEEIFAMPAVQQYEQMGKGTSRPERLFHYTSLQGLQGIVSNREVWATDVRFFNDAREFAHGLDLAKSVVDGVAATEIEDELRHAIRGVLSSPPERERWAVFSLSEKGDLLSQWRGYCPPSGGYSIGFDPGKLKTMTLARGLVFGLRPCLYDEAIQRDFLEGYVYKQMELFTNQYGSPLGRVEQHREALWYNILRSCVLFKHAGFSEESEWRLSGIPSHSSTPWAYRVGARMLVPYVRLEFPLEVERHPIADVIIGPTSQPELAEISLRGMLDSHGLRQVRIKHSDIPYRTL
jgi:hypothetical protein